MISYAIPVPHVPPARSMRVLAWVRPNMHKCVYLCAAGDVGHGRTEPAACSEGRDIEDAHTAPSAVDGGVACAEQRRARPPRMAQCRWQQEGRMLTCASGQS